MVKRPRNILLIIIALLLLAYLFRGFLYRHTISYHIMASRPSYVIRNDSLSAYINESIKQSQNNKIKSLIDLALDVTTDKLYYCSSNTSNNPNQLISHQRAHCVGYAAFTATVCNEIFHKFN